MKAKLKKNGRIKLDVSFEEAEFLYRLLGNHVKTKMGTKQPCDEMWNELDDLAIYKRCNFDSKPLETHEGYKSVLLKD